MPLFVGASESYDTDAWETYNLKKENTKLLLSERAAAERAAAERAAAHRWQLSDRELDMVRLLGVDR